MQGYRLSPSVRGVGVTFEFMFPGSLVFELSVFTLLFTEFTEVAGVAAGVNVLTGVEMAAGVERF